MPFAFGGSSQSSSSRSQGQSTSASSGQSTSNQGSAGGSISGGSSISGSQTGSVGSSGQNIAFEDVFARLFGDAEGLAGNLDPSILTDAANQLFGGGMQFLEGLGGDAGTGYLEQRLGGDNQVLNEQIGLLQEDIGRLFSEELNPAITSEAVAGGTLGGGRQGVAQGQAMDIAGREFARGASALRSDDLARRDEAAKSLTASNIAGAQTGISGLQQVMAMAQAEMGSSMIPSQMLAQILGPMQALTFSNSSSFGSSFANAEDFARAFSSSFGNAQSTNDSRSQASQSSSSRSRGRSLSLGFGGGG